MMKSSKKRASSLSSSSSSHIAPPPTLTTLFVFCSIVVLTSATRSQWRTTTFSFSRPKQQQQLQQLQHSSESSILCGDWICRKFPRGGDDNAEAAATTSEPSSSSSSSSSSSTSTLSPPPAAAEEKGGEEEEEEEVSLDERVNAAMKKLGIVPPEEEEGGANDECEGGACPLPTTTTTDTVASNETKEDVDAIAKRIAKEMEVDVQIVLAAIGATTTFEDDDMTKPQYNEHAARELISAEMEAIGAVGGDAEEVQQLVAEGHDEFLARRALAFAEMNVDDARAILLADREDEEMEIKQQEEAEKAFAAEEAAREKAKAESEMKTVTVDANFDPTALPGAGGKSSAASMGMPGVLPQQSQQQQQQQMPKEANKADVVFDATTADLQRLVMESPVPVLIDVYADWCGPCKALTPALEQMAVKAGGMFRLVKINTDNERPVSAALEVKALPTVFAVKDGKVVNSFQGMPPNEQFMRDFMVGFLTPGEPFKPAVSAEQKSKFAELSSKLIKVACTASFSFSARERLQDRTSTRLDELVAAYDGDMGDAEGSAKVLRSLLSNVIRDPYETKFRTVNLENKVIASKVGSYPPCLAILKSVGFSADEGGAALVLGKGKRGVNIAPLLVARDCIDKWIDQNRYKIAAAARKRRDEVERARLAAEAEAAAANADEEDDYEEEEEVDPNACVIKLRMEGKKKVHDLEMDGDDPLSKVISSLPVSIEEGQTVQLTCAARRLVVKSTDEEAMSKTLREHKLFPSAAVVVKVGDGTAKASKTSSLSERAAAQKSKKKGSHTMQSVGIYAKDDNNKSELIDMGGGVWYEHDVTDDEDEKGQDSSKDDAPEEDNEEEDNETSSSKEVDDAPSQEDEQ